MKKFRKVSAIIIAMFVALSLLAGCRKIVADIMPNILDAKDSTSASTAGALSTAATEIDESLPVTSTSATNPAATTVQPATNSNEFVTNFFDVDVRIVSNNSFLFTETIDVTFNAERHGIFRTIPITGQTFKTVNGQKVYSDCQIVISDIKVEGYEYSAYTEGNEQIIKIGNPNSTVTGHYKYIIQYKCAVVDGDKATQFYWNLLPSQWEVPIRKSKITISLPAKIDRSHISFYGDVGYSYSVDNKTIVATIGEPFVPGNNFTVLIDFPVGFFKP